MRRNSIHSWAAAAACWGMIVAPAATAAPTGQTLAVIDVALADGGVLRGQVLTAQGAPAAGAPVVISHQGREIVSMAANHDGAFAAQGLKGGVYEITTPGASGVYRLWAPATAPPSARRGLMIVTGTETARGQFAPPPPGVEPPPPPPQQGPFGKAMGWISEHPFITAGIVATAIAVPLALDDDDDDAS